MTAGGNPDPETPADESNVYPERECPLCGKDDVKDLPAHLRHHCEATP